MRAINENKAVNFLKDGNAAFLKACADVPPPWGKKPLFNKEGIQIVMGGIPATRRQASRWMMGKGIAYKVHKRIV